MLARSEYHEHGIPTQSELKLLIFQRLQEVREGIHFVVTATSRAKRPGEVDGKDYYFVTKEEFLSMIERNDLLEYALVYGDYKGIPKQQVSVCIST